MNVVKLSPGEIDMFLTGIRNILEEGRGTVLYIAYDPIDRAIKAKVDNGTWSPPLGTEVTT